MTTGWCPWGCDVRAEGLDEREIVTLLDFLDYECSGVPKLDYRSVFEQDAWQVDGQRTLAEARASR